MSKKLIIPLTAVLLAIIILLLVIVNIGKKESDYMKHEQTVKYLSDAIRTMADSDFKDFDLASRMYLHAFTNPAKIVATFGDCDTTLTALLENNANEDSLKALVCYGGTAINTLNGTDIKPCEKIDASDVYVGDLLILKSEGEAKLYIKDKEHFVNLLNAVENVALDTALDQVKNSEVFALFRPMKIMENYDFPTKKLPKVELTKEQEAVIAIAESYLLRGDKLQYADTRLGSDAKSEFRWKSGHKAPEDCTNDDLGYTNCAAFTYDVYFHSLGIDMDYNGSKLNTTANYAQYSPELGISKYKMICKNADEYTEEEKEKIKEEILDIIEPADILVVRRANGNGHAMLYTGNENIIHSSGSVYNLNEAKEVYEASIRRMRFKDYFFTEDTGGYIFGADTGKQIVSFTIVRPLDKWTGEISSATKNRVDNLSGIMAQKTSTHNAAKTVNCNEEITFTFEVNNMNDNEISLEICDTVPEYTTYVSGADTVIEKLLKWNVTVAANSRKKVSYTVKVDPSVEYGTAIKSNESYVGGVPVKCEAITVNRTLTAEEQAKIVLAVNNIKADDQLNGLALVNKIYSDAFSQNEMFDTDFKKVTTDAIDGVFAVSGIEESTIGLSFTLNSYGKYRNMLAPTLYGGRRFASYRWCDRTRLARERNLVVGDILLRKTSQNEEVYIYVGDDKFYKLSNGLSQDTLTAKRRLETCLAAANFYVILRPSFALN